MAKAEGKLEKLRTHYRTRLGGLRERLRDLRLRYNVGTNPETLESIHKVPESEKEKVRKELEEIENAYYDLLHEMDKRDKRIRRTDSWNIYEGSFVENMYHTQHVLFEKKGPICKYCRFE